MIKLFGTLINVNQKSELRISEWYCCTRMQRILKTIQTLSCLYSLESWWVLSEEYKESGFQPLSLHHFVMVKLATSSKRVKHACSLEQDILYYHDELNSDCCLILSDKKMIRDKTNTNTNECPLWEHLFELGTFVSWGPLWIEHISCCQQLLLSVEISSLFFNLYLECAHGRKSVEHN